MCIYFTWLNPLSQHLSLFFKSKNIFRKLLVKYLCWWRIVHKGLLSLYLLVSSLFFWHRLLLFRGKNNNKTLRFRFLSDLAQSFHQSLHNRCVSSRSRDGWLFISRSLRFWPVFWMISNSVTNWMINFAILNCYWSSSCRISLVELVILNTTFYNILILYSTCLIE